MKCVEEFSIRNLEHDKGSNEVSDEMKEIILNVDLPPVGPHSGDVSFGSSYSSILSSEI